MIRRHGAELILHGHSHVPSLYWLDGPAGKIPVVGVAAAGQVPGSARAAAQFNLLDIDGEPGRWGIRLTRRGLTGPAAPPVEIEALELGAPRELEAVRS